MKKNTTNKRLRIFDFQRDGKGVSKNEKQLPPGLRRFFVSYKNNFGKLVSVNIFFVLGNFPILFLIATLSGVTKNDIFMPLSDLFQNIGGLFTADGGMTPYKLSLFAIEGLQDVTYAPSILTYVFYGISLITIFTFGIVNVGTAYIQRNMVSGEPVFVWQDFWYAVKRNWKQAIPFGIIDVAVSILLGTNIMFYVTNLDAFINQMLFWVTVVLSILYFFMRYYVYLQMVTFKLTVFKILKNSLVFALIGIKRNVMAFIGIIFAILLELIFLFATGGILLPIAIAAPLAILISTSSYMKVYAAYFKIKEIMIDPYLEEHPELNPENNVNDDEEIIMRDDVTERERLLEIKRRNGIIDDSDE